MNTVTRHPRLFLQPRAQRRLQSGYPWIFSNEVKMDPATKALPPGSVVTVAEAGGELLATAHFNPRTLISARVLAHYADAAVDLDFVETRLTAALALRDRLYNRPFYRLIHAEADGLPGLVIDRFGDVFVLQPNTAGMDRLVPTLVETLVRLTNPRAIIVRGDTPARGLEGLEQDVRLVHGALDGDVPVEENGATFFCDLTSGQKTGWFFDQRDIDLFKIRRSFQRSHAPAAGRRASLPSTVRPIRSISRLKPRKPMALPVHLKRPKSFRSLRTRSVKRKRGRLSWPIRRLL